MSFLSRLFGGGGATEAAGSLGSIAKDLEDVFTTSDRERLDLYTAETERVRATQAVDVAHARHRSVFVAGARPFILWVGGFGMAYHFLFFPLVGPFITELTDVKLVELNWGELSAMVAGVLGMSGWRTAEKLKGVSRERL